MRPIDADALPIFGWPQAWEEGVGIARCCDAVEQAPTLDVVPVVRCKDCEYYKTESGECPANNGDDPYYSWIPKPDWYCAEGKRKEGA